MNPYNFSTLFFAFGSFFMGLFVWLKRNDKIGRSYFIFSLFVTIWGIFISIVFSQSVSYFTALFSARLSDTSAIFIPISWFRFVLAFTERENKYKTTVKVTTFLSFILAVTGFSPLFILSMRSIVGIKYYPVPGPSFFIFTIMFHVLVLLSYVELISAIKSTSGKRRQALIGLTLATLFGFTGGTLTFLPCYGLEVPQYGVFLMPLYPFLMAYAMIRRSLLFDLEDLALAAHKDKLAAIGTLAASINHEIRNPLYIIQGSADSFLALTQEGALSNPSQALTRSQETLKRISEQAARAIDIMKRFAVFSKQGVHEDPVLNSVSLSETFHNIRALVGHEAELEKIQITENLAGGDLKVKADPRHLEQILFNLMINACQELKRRYPSGGGKIEISAEQKGREVRLTIQDNGAGIPPEQLSKIFEPFYTTKSEGTGLGLYVTRQLVQKNHGRHTVHSGEGRGTAFQIVFPSSEVDRLLG